MPAENQLARYGSVAKAIPFSSGKTFFLFGSSEVILARFLNLFPNDADGVPRIVTSYAAAITAIQAEPDSGVGCTLYVSAGFTTAPTLLEIDSLNAAKVSVYFMATKSEDGSYSTAKAPFAVNVASTTNLFTVTGRVEVLDIVAEVATTTGAVANSAKFQVVPTVGSTTDLCSSTSIASLAAGGTLLITGVFTAALVATTQGAIARQATPFIVKAGTIALVLTTTTTGNFRARVRFKPLEPGATVIPA